MLKNIIKSIFNWFNFLFFLLRNIRAKFWQYSIPSRQEGALVLLGNGPSLNNEFENILAKQGHFGISRLMCLNWFAEDSRFFEITPEFYVLADPAFWAPGEIIRERIQKLYSIFEKITWDITFIVPGSLMAAKNHTFPLKNKNIHFLAINTVEYKGPEFLRNWAYKKNLAAPRIQNVANLAIFSALQLGFEQIFLYGVDHTFFDGLCVNEHNILCKQDSHFYKAEKVKPFYKSTESKTTYKMAEYVQCIAYMFQSHEFLQKYAEYLKDRSIINCTKCSLIDCYPRENMIRPENESNNLLNNNL